MQEHAEGPGSKPMKLCKHCGARLHPDERVCPKCETEQGENPGTPNNLTASPQRDE